MHLHSCWLFFCTMMISLALLGCGGEETTTPVEKQPVESTTTTPDTPNIPTQPSIPIEPSAVVAKVTSPLEVLPPMEEPAGDPTLGWADVNEDNWGGIRKMYVLQYVENPKSIIWALNHPVPKNAAQFVEKGYGTCWPPNWRSPKEVELGILAARNKNEPLLVEQLQRLEQQGGQYYMLLVYTASWYYCFAGKNDVAKNLVEKTNLEAQIALYGLSIPVEHLAALRAKTQELPTFVAPPTTIEVPVVPTTPEVPAVPTTPEVPAVPTTPEGETPAPEGETPAPEGETPAPEGELPAPEGELPTPEGELPAPEGELPAPEGELPAPEGELPAPEGELPAPEGE